MTSAEALSPEGEAEWQRLRQQIEWCDHFALVLVFSAHPQVLEVFRARLAALYRARVTGLELGVVQDFDDPNTMIAGVLTRLLRPSEHRRALDAPTWVDLSRHLEPRWAQARQVLLARLNERRERLRTALVRPIVLVLPVSEHAQVVATAPDLWAIRDSTVFTGDWLPSEPPLEPAFAEPPPFTRGEPTPLDTAAIAEWDRVKGSPRPDHGLRRAAHRASEALGRLGRLDESATVARRVVEIARALTKDRDEDPTALLDLADALDLCGVRTFQLGDLDAAARDFEEALDLCRQVVDRVGAAPESLRCLYIALARKADVALQLGQLDAAAKAFEEALDLCRKHLAIVGETPAALQDLSIALNNSGELALRLGRLGTAAAAFEESLELCRKLVEIAGEEPEALRALSMALTRTGEVAVAQGRLDEASTAFHASLDLRRKIVRLLGETPQSLYDLCVAIERTGRVARRRGDTEAEERCGSEALELLDRVRQAAPSPEAADRLEHNLRALVVSPAPPSGDK